MKYPARTFLTLLIGCGLLSLSPIFGQEPPTKDRSSKEAHEKKLIGAPPQIRTRLESSGAVDFKLEAPPTKRPPKKTEPPEPAGVMIMVEWIKVEHEDFSDWAFENKLAVDATELRKAVQKWLKEEDAEILRTAVIQARSGQRAKLESIKEVIYPSEYHEGFLPLDLTLDDAESPVIPPHGRAYETRNAGTTVEVDPVISEGGQLIDLNLSPQMIFRLDDIEWASSSNGEKLVTKQPLFYAMMVSTQVTVKNGGYALIATLQLPPEEGDDDADGNEEIVLLFVRADAS